MSPRFDAGSVVNRIASRRRSAAAIETVVFPTPPLPPIRTMRRPARESNASFTVASVDADVRLVALVRGGSLTRHLFAPRPDVAQRLEHLLLLGRVLLLGTLPGLQPHLQLDQPLLPRLIVEQLLVRHRLDLLHDPLEPGDGRLEREEEDVGEKKHGATSPPAPASAECSRSCTAATAPCRGTTACSHTSWRSRRSGRRTPSSSRAPTGTRRS